MPPPKQNTAWDITRLIFWLGFVFIILSLLSGARG